MITELNSDRLNTAPIYRAVESSDIQSENYGFTWKGDGNDFQQEPIISDESNAEQIYKILMPIVRVAPDIVCYISETDALSGDEEVLYTVRLIADYGEIKSPNSSLELPAVLVQDYAWIQGYSFDFVGKAEICKISPVGKRTTFLIDGEDAKNITNDNGFVFHLPDGITDFIVEPKPTVYVYVGNVNGTPHNIFVQPDPRENPDYRPHYRFESDTFVQGYEWLRILKSGDTVVQYRSGFIDRSDDPYFYIDGRKVVVQPASKD